MYSVDIYTLMKIYNCFLFNYLCSAHIPSQRQWFNDLSCSSSQSCINICNGCPSNYSTVNCSSNTDTYIYCGEFMRYVGVVVYSFFY